MSNNRQKLILIDYETKLPYEVDVKKALDKLRNENHSNVRQVARNCTIDKWGSLPEIGLRKIDKKD